MNLIHIINIIDALNIKLHLCLPSIPCITMNVRACRKTLLQTLVLYSSQCMQKKKSQLDLHRFIYVINDTNVFFKRVQRNSLNF